MTWEFSTRKEIPPARTFVKLSKELYDKEKKKKAFLSSCEMGERGQASGEITRYEVLLKLKVQNSL